MAPQNAKTLCIDSYQNRCVRNDDDDDDEDPSESGSAFALYTSFPCVSDAPLALQHCMSESFCAAKVVRGVAKWKDVAEYIISCSCVICSDWWYIVLRSAYPTIVMTKMWW